MNEITTVSTKGQVTIPQDIRQFLQIKVGDKVAFTLPILRQKRQITLKIISQNVVKELAGSLASKTKQTDHRIAREKAGITLAKKYRLEK